MLQARQLGSELLVGVHSDEAILENKGPTVMHLNERIMAVEACRWATKAVPHAPYVTSLPWISHYGCHYVVHGDDITSDSDGKDCYRYVKAAGRFKVVKRTPGISTTDLVGRMLLCTKSHFIQSLDKRLSGDEGPGGELERQKEGEAMLQRIKDYATDESGKAPGCDVWYWHASRPAKLRRTTTSNANNVTSNEARPGVARSQTASSTAGPVKEEKGKFHQLVHGKGVKPGQVVVYVDGGWDLFSSGHIEFLRKVTEIEETAALERGWYTESAKTDRISKTGSDYGPVFLIAGIHDDEVINHWKGINYPIMNIFERGLCVLQCKVGHSLKFPTHKLTLYQVHPRRHLRRPLLPLQSLPSHAPLRHAHRRLPRHHQVHAADLRPLRRRQDAQHLPRGRKSRVPERERCGDCGAHHEEPVAV
jgi:ethanolamine-phosphate cytidylyltransferase